MPVNMTLKSNIIMPRVKAYLSMFFPNTAMNTTDLSFIGVG